MADWGAEGDAIVNRIDTLRRERADGSKEPIADFCKRAGLNETALSKWRHGDGSISLRSLMRIVEANPGVSIDWLVFGKSADSDQYRQLLDRLASEVIDALNRTYELTPERKVVELRRIEPPDEAPE